MAAIQEMLGSGIYTVQEASLYARVSTQVMSRWLFGNSAGRAVIVPQFGEDEDRFISFLDFVQTLAIREIRLQKKVPLNKFRQAIQVAKTSLGLDYPFARRHCTYLLGDELVISRSKDELIEASGKHKGQIIMPFMEIYLESLSFSLDGLAELYAIYRSPDDVPIKMDPRFRFGEPLLPSGYSAMTIWDAIQDEGGIDPASRAYGISKEETQAAYLFFVDHLGKTAA